MSESAHDDFVIREASRDDHVALGDLIFRAYVSLPGMPDVEVARDYYDDLRDVSRYAESDGNTIVAAYRAGSGQLLGGTVFIREYGKLFGIEGAAGIRLLAVEPDIQSRGVGRAVLEHCIAETRRAGCDVMLLHTMRAMQAAQRMYTKRGFVREPAIDFEYAAASASIMGYRLDLES